LEKMLWSKKFTREDQLLVVLLYLNLWNITLVVSMKTLLVIKILFTKFQLLDLVLRMELNIGLLEILGVLTGVKKVSSE
jgi:hypothetical protein